MFNIIANRKIYFIFSGILCLVSVISLALWGLNLGIDFTGGTLMELEFLTPPRPSTQAVQEKLAFLNLGKLNLEPVGERGAILRFKPITEEIHQQILEVLKTNFARVPPPEAKNLRIEEVIEEKRFESIGPIIGRELKRKTLWAIFGVLLGIILYIAWAFRKVSRPVTSWKYGLCAIIALVHDILIVAGVFSLLGRFGGVEIDTLFVTALLTILGYSVHDTIVVFDRTRENLARWGAQDFSQVVNKSVNETITRSLNTSLTTLLVLGTLYFFGGISIRHFILALILGIIVGTYSSIFIASPLLVTWEERRR